MRFSEYVEHGLSLCRIEKGSKRPVGNQWHQPGNALTTEQADAAQGVGVVHLLSGTCALDIDHLESARKMLSAEGVDLDALLDAPDAVRIDSGREGRAKLLFRTDEPLGTMKKANGHGVAFELRCATRKGTSTQDVLPGAIHPDTGKRYTWDLGLVVGHWWDIPELPPELRAYWEKVAPFRAPAQDTPNIDSAAQVEPSEEDYTKAREYLASADPNMGYNPWVKVGMALHHSIGPDGFDMWREWSAESDKFKGEEDLLSHWRSFGEHPEPATLEGLSRNVPASADEFDTILDESADEILDDKPTIPLYDMAAMLRQKPTQWIIKGVMPDAELTMVYGPSGAGKSFIVLDMAMSILRGKDWMGHKAKQGAVLWLAAEAYGSMGPRILAYCKGQGISEEEASELPMIATEGVDLTSRRYVDALLDSVEDKQFTMVIVDTLAAASGGLNENAGEDMNALLANCRHIYQRTKANVTLIHHSGKDESKGARGWSGIKAAVHAELRVSYDESGRAITATKQRDGVEGGCIPFKLTSVSIGMDEDGDIVDSAYVEASEQGSRVEKEKALPAAQSLVMAALRDTQGAGTQGVPRSVLVEAAVKLKTGDRNKSRTTKQVENTVADMLVEGTLTQTEWEGETYIQTEVTDNE